ncbi:MAG: hypothetical protein MUF07_07360 [Steroidobacteraceae bacterium]|nr:hypothetical protein [Steroidobacteraceae bacterium]
MDDLNAVRAAIEYSTEPRVTFFDDPAVDRVLGITMAVAQEVGTVLERLDTMERLLVQSGALQAGALQAYVPDAPVARQRLAIQEAFVTRLLRVVEQELVALRTEQAGARGAGAGAAAATRAAAPDPSRREGGRAADAA